MNYTKKDIANIDDLRLRFSDTANERAVLTLVLRDETLLYTLMSRVSFDDFLSPDTRALYNTLTTAHKLGIKSFDIPVLSKIAGELGFQELTDESYLMALKRYTVSASNFDHYVSKLLDDSTKFKLYLKVSEDLDSLYHSASELDTATSEDYLNSIQGTVLDLSLSSKAIEEPVHVGDGLEEYIKSIEDQKVEFIGLSTGYPLLDKAIDGLVDGTLFIVAARKKMGKSTFLTNIAANVSVRQQKPTLYIDTEMTFVEWRCRLLSIMSGVEERVIKHGGFKGNDAIYDRIKKAVEYLNYSKLYHYYLPGYSVDKLAALYKKYKIKEDIQLGIFDYIKEPDLSSVDKGRKEHQILGDVTTKLKDLAGQLSIPFAAAVQLNRSGDVADSDRIARYGDVVAFWGLRDAKEAEENAWDLDEIGHYGLSIRDSRRGGTTGSAGIGYWFYHSKLTIKEVPLENQVERYLFTSEATLETTDFNNQHLNPEEEIDDTKELL